MIAVTVEFNGKSYDLEVGKTGVISCANIRMETDFWVTFHATASFSYDGLTTVGEVGKRTGLKCAGKWMLSDIVVTGGVPSNLDSPLPIEVKTAEEMNTILRLATDESIGAVYKYVGDESDVYDTGDLYIITQEDA